MLIINRNPGYKCEDRRNRSGGYGYGGYGSNNPYLPVTYTSEKPPQEGWISDSSESAPITLKFITVGDWAEVVRVCVCVCVCVCACVRVCAWPERVSHWTVGSGNMYTNLHVL